MNELSADPSQDSGSWLTWEISDEALERAAGTELAAGTQIFCPTLDDISCRLASPAMVGS